MSLVTTALDDGPDEPGADDRPLLDRARVGDRSAFAELYDRHVRAVYWQALGVVGDSVLAEDVTQDVFITFWDKVRTVRVVDTSVLPWLLVTARYQGLNARRRLQRERLRSTALDDELRSLDHDHDLVDEAVLRGEVQAEIDKAVASLSGPDRRVYDLCLAGDHSYESAARELGVSHASVRNRLSRVRNRLRADLHALRETS